MTQRLKRPTLLASNCFTCHLPQLTNWKARSNASSRTQRTGVERKPEVKRILDLPENKQKLMEIGAVASPMTPDQFTAFIATERAKWEPVVVASGAKAQ